MDVAILCLYCPSPCLPLPQIDIELKIVALAQIVN